MSTNRQPPSPQRSINERLTLSHKWERVGVRASLLPLLSLLLTACFVFTPTHVTHDIALGDLDSDGDLDAFAASFQDGYRIWLNQGKGDYERTN